MNLEERWAYIFPNLFAKSEAGFLFGKFCFKIMVSFLIWILTALNRFTISKTKVEPWFMVE